MSNPEDHTERFSGDELASLMSDLRTVQANLTLHVTDGVSERIVYFTRSGVRLLASGQRVGPSLHDYLLETGRITVDSLHETLEESRHGKKELRRVLVEKGVLDQDQCDRILTRLVFNSLCELVFWKNSFFKVHADTPPEELFSAGRDALQVTVDTTQLGEAVAAWVDEWKNLRAVLHGDEAWITVTYAGRKTGGTESPEAEEILKHCGEKTQLRRLWQTLQYGVPEICRTVAELAGKKMVTVESDDSDEQVPPEEEIAELEDSLRHVVEKDVVRQRLITLYRKTHRYADAAEQMAHFSNAAIENENWSVALRYLKDILHIQPGNTDAFRKMVRTCIKSDQIAEITNFAPGHWRRLLGKAMLDEVEQCLVAVKGIDDLTSDALETKAALFASRGDKRHASTEYLRAAKLCDELGERGRAASMLRKALTYEAGKNPVKPGAAASPALNAAPQRSSSDTTTTAASTSASAAPTPAAPKLTPKRRNIFPRPQIPKKIVAAAVLLFTVGAYWTGAADFLFPIEFVELAEAEGRFKAIQDWFTSEAEDLEEEVRSLTAFDRDGDEEETPAPTPPRNSRTPQRDRRDVPDVRRELPEDGSGVFSMVSDFFFDGGDEGARDDADASAASPSQGDTSRTSAPADVAPPSRPVRQAPSSSEHTAQSKAEPRTIPWSPTIALHTEAQCLEEGVLRTRVLTGDLRALYADSCSLFVYRKQGGLVREMPREEGTRWAIGYRGRAFCRWNPGGIPTIFLLSREKPIRLNWIVPDQIEAIAVGNDRLAMREGKLTAIFEFDGTPIGSAKMPMWTEAVFAQGSLILSRPRPSGQGHVVWVVDEQSLEIRWYCFEENGGLVIR